MKKEWIVLLMILGLIFGCNPKEKERNEPEATIDIIPQAQETKIANADTTVTLEGIRPLLRTKTEESKRRERAIRTLVPKAQANLDSLKKLIQDPDLKDFVKATPYRAILLNPEMVILRWDDDQNRLIVTYLGEIKEITSQTAIYIIEAFSKLTPDLVLSSIKEILEKKS